MKLKSLSLAFQRPDGMSPGDLRKWLLCQLEQYGDPLRWAITSIDSMGDQSSDCYLIVEAVVIID